jgi:hypothetical protein
MPVVLLSKSAANCLCRLFDNDLEPVLSQIGSSFMARAMRTWRQKLTSDLRPIAP